MKAFIEDVFSRGGHTAGSKGVARGGEDRGSAFGETMRGLDERAADEAGATKRGEREGSTEAPDATGGKPAEEATATGGARTEQAKSDDAGGETEKAANADGTALDRLLQSLRGDGSGDPEAAARLGGMLTATGGAKGDAASLSVGVARLLAETGARDGIAAKAGATTSAAGEPATGAGVQRGGVALDATGPLATKLAAVLADAGNRASTGTQAGTAVRERVDLVSMRTHFEPETMARVAGQSDGTTVRRGEGATLAAGTARGPLAGGALAQADGFDEAKAPAKATHVGGERNTMPPRAGESIDRTASVETARPDARTARVEAARTEASQPAAGMPATATAGGGLAGQAVSAIGREFGAFQGERPEASGRVVLRAGGASMKTIQIKLQPIALGTLDVTMQIVNGRLSINLVASQAETAMRLNENSRELRGLLQNAGFQVDDAAITVTARDGPSHGVRAGDGQSQATQSGQSGSSGQQNGSGQNFAGQGGREAGPGSDDRAPGRDEKGRRDDSRRADAGPAPVEGGAARRGADVYL